MSQDARNYYDEQFSKRINEIAKPGAQPSSSGRSSGWGARGFGGIIAVAIVFGVRLLIGLGSSSSNSTPSYQYTPPSYSVPPPKFDFPEQKQMPIENQGNKPLTEEEVQRLLKQLQEKDKD